MDENWGRNKEGGTEGVRVIEKDSPVTADDRVDWDSDMDKGNDMNRNCRRGQQGSRELFGWDLGQMWEVVVYDSIAARAGASSHSFPGSYLRGCLSLLIQEVLGDKHIEQNKNVIFAHVGTRGGFWRRCSLSPKGCVLSLGLKLALVVEGSGTSVR